MARRRQGIKERVRERPLAPTPEGFVSGKRSRLRRFIAWTCARLNELANLCLPDFLTHAMAHRGLEITETEIQLRRGGPGLDGLRIVFLSDLHAGSCMGEKRLVRIFERVQELRPDLVCIGGDLINTREREILLYREPLAQIDPPLGVFAVPGNHDHFWGKDIGLWEAFLEKRDVHVLKNRGLRIEREGASLWVAGVDDLTEGTPDLPTALDGARDDEPILLLSHHPDFFFEAAAVGVDLCLSGHTHGGQVLLFGWTPFKHSRFGYWKGRHQKLDSQLYVGRGVGVTFLPIRYAARPELAVLTLRAPRETQAAQD